LARSVEAETALATIYSAIASMDHIIRAALGCLEKAWRDGYAYKKAEIILLERVNERDVPRDFLSTAPASKAKYKALMKAIDRTNARFGRN
jgi:DNA polymerase V